MTQLCKLISFAFASIAASFGNVFLMTTTKSFCVISTMSATIDVHCRSTQHPQLAATQKSPPQSDSSVYCQTLMGQKGFVLKDVELYFPCSKWSCPGAFGCEACCFEDPKATEAATRDDDDRMTRASKQGNDEESPPIETTDEPPLLLDIMKGVVLLLTIITIVVFTTLFCLFCSDKKRRVTKVKSDQIGATKVLIKAKQPKSLMSNAKCYNLPTNQSKLNGRSCKVCPKGSNRLQLGDKKKCKPSKKTASTIIRMFAMAYNVGKKNIFVV